jgi:hypothetical protein
VVDPERDLARTKAYLSRSSVGTPAAVPSAPPESVRETRREAQAASCVSTTA